MSEILKRTIFIDTRNGDVKVSDFARVVTTLGTMIEPFDLANLSSFGIGNIQNLDYTDSMVRVDEISNFDSRDPTAHLADTPNTMGGTTTLRAK